MGLGIEKGIIYTTLCIPFRFDDLKWTVNHLMYLASEIENHVSGQIQEIGIKIDNQHKYPRLEIKVFNNHYKESESDNE
jgi:hypothetical protein